MVYILQAAFAAILFLLPFFKPEIFFWTSLFCIIPLLRNLNSYHKKGISRAEFLIAGIVFSLIVINIHLLWFWKLLSSAGSSSRLVFGFITSAYFSLILFAPFLPSSLLRHNKTLSKILFVFAFCLSIYYISYHSFIIFGRNEGYFLFDPVIPFISLIKEKELRSNFIALCPNSLNEGGCNRAHQLSSCLARELFNKKEHCLVLFPESTFPYDLEQYKEFIPAWCDCHDNVDIVIGAHKQEGDKIFNCAYHIHNGEIKDVYKKRHLVLFFESIPRLFDGYGVSSIFAKKDKTFSYPGGDNGDIFMIDGEMYQVFICSELYQRAKPVKKDVKILFIGNSSWFMMDYAKNLARLHARFFFVRHSIKSDGWKFMNNVETLSSVQC